MFKLFGIVSAIVLFIATPSSAVRIDISYSSYIDATAFGGGANDTFDINLSLDPNTPDLLADPNLGKYYDLTALGSLSIGTETVSFTGRNTILILNDYGSSGVDRFSFSTSTNSVFSGSIYGNQISALDFFVSSTGNPGFLDSDDLPTDTNWSTPGIGDRHRVALGMTLGASTIYTTYTVASDLGYDFSASTPSPVPLPASLPLLIGALFSLGLFRNRRNRKLTA